MGSHKAAAVALSLWSGLNLLLGLGIVVAMLLGQDPPSVAMVFSPAEVAALDPKALGLIRALAVLFNGCAASFCGLVLLLVWSPLTAGRRSAFLAVAASTSLVQALGFVSDSHIGGHNLVANLVSSALLLTGLVLSRPPSIASQPRPTA